MAKKTALITGASAGLGKAFARHLAKAHHMDLVVTARRADRLAQLKDELKGTAVKIIPADLSEPGAARAIFEQVTEAGIDVDLLVNNAGFALPGRFLSHTFEEHSRFIQVMVTAVAEMTHLFLPGMVGRGYGRIINVSSLAALVPGSPGHTLYGAAKAFLVKMSESLSFELTDTGVFVTASCPGFTHTEFHDVLGNREQVSKLPKIVWMDADEVVRGAVEAVMEGKVHHIPGGFNQAMAKVYKHIPTKAGLWLMGRQGQRIRKQ